MAKITIFGGTGYAGSNIAKEAAARGHEVTVIARQAPAVPLGGVTYQAGSVLDAELVNQVVENSDVVISALAPRGNMLGQVRPAIGQLAQAAAGKARIGVIGGAGSLLTTEGGPRLVDTPAFTEEYKPEALEMADVLGDLQATDESLDWFYVSPAGSFGGFNPGERRGSYRVGDDVIVVDAEGVSDISGEDFGLAIIDEIEHPKHVRARFTVAY